MTRRRVGSDPLPALLAVLAAAVVYHPIVEDYFKYDDFLHLYQIANHGPLEFLLTPHGGHLLISSNLVFYFCYRLFGLEAAGYQWVALLTHLLCVWMLQRALRSLTDRPRLAAAAAAFWGMAPMAYGSIHWFSVYGHALAGASIAWWIGDVARLERAGAAASLRRQLGWLAVLLLAATSFGVGLGVAAASGPILYLLRPTAPDRRRVALRFASLVVLLPALYELQHRAFELVSGVEVKQLTPHPSLLDHLAVVADLLIAGTGTLLLGPLGALHGSAVSFGPLAGLGHAGLLELCYAATALAGAGLLFAAARASPALRSQLLGLLLVAASAYGIVALGRVGVMHKYDQSRASVAITPRYHYVGPLALGALLGAALGAALPAPRSRGGAAGRPPARRLLPLAALLVVAAPTYGAAVRSFDAPGREFRIQHRRILHWIETSARRHPVGTAVYLPNRKMKTLGRVSPEEFPRAAALFVLSRPSLEVDGRRVYFVEKRWSVLGAAAARPGTPITRVLVGPGDPRGELEAGVILAPPEP